MMFILTLLLTLGLAFSTMGQVDTSCDPKKGDCATNSAKSGGQVTVIEYVTMTEYATVMWEPPASTEPNVVAAAAVTHKKNRYTAATTTLTTTTTVNVEVPTSIVANGGSPQVKRAPRRRRRRNTPGIQIQDPMEKTKETRPRKVRRHGGR